LASTSAVDQLHRRFAFDVDYDPVTRAVRYAQPKDDKAFAVNGRFAVADLPMSNGARLTVPVWAVTSSPSSTFSTSRPAPRPG